MHSFVGSLNIHTIIQKHKKKMINFNNFIILHSLSVYTTTIYLKNIFFIHSYSIIFILNIIIAFHIDGYIYIDTIYIFI